MIKCICIHCTLTMSGKGQGLRYGRNPITPMLNWVMSHMVGGSLHAWPHASCVKLEGDTRDDNFIIM